MCRQDAPILVVDDDPTILRLLSLTFLDAGFRVLEARDGAEALATTRRQRPGVIVLDLEMPVMDGASCCRELRRRGDRTPVLVLSAHGAGWAARGLDVEAWMDKPYDEARLVKRVRELYELGRQRRAARRDARTGVGRASG